MRSTTVTLPYGGPAELHQSLLAANALHGDWDELVIRVPEGWRHPGVLAFLDCWGRLMVSEGRRFRFEGNPGGTLAYLSRMDLFKHLDFDFIEWHGRLNETGRFMPIKIIDDDRSVVAAVDTLCELALRRFDHAREFLPAMEWAVNEIIDNVRIHSETRVPGAVCAQFTRNDQLHVGIMDMGRGVRASLSESHAVPTDADALTLAVTRGITRNPAIGQGNGLAGTRAIVACNRGEMSLWSGGAVFSMRGGVDRAVRTVPEMPFGTGVSLTLRTRNPVDLARTFIARRDWTYLNVVCRDLEEHGLVVKRECVHVGGRENAIPLRRKIEALLPDMENRLVLDFEGIANPSSSFLDELVARLVATLGPTEFHRQVKVVGMTSRVQAMTDVVIQQRLAEGCGSVGVS